jgi:hypothetical protein
VNLDVGDPSPLLKTHGDDPLLRKATDQILVFKAGHCHKQRMQLKSDNERSKSRTNSTGQEMILQ